MKFDLELPTLSGIKIIGVGGAGVSILKKFQDSPLPDVELFAMDSSKNMLESILTPYKIKLQNSEREKRRTDTIKNELFPYLEDSKLIFIISGLGGETTSIYLPPLAKILKETGILTIGILIFPFRFEGRMREERARETKEILKENVDALLSFPNDYFYRLFHDLPLPRFISNTNSIIYNVIKSILEPFFYPSLINLEIPSLRKILEGAGDVMVGWGEEKGEKRAMKVVEKGLSSITWGKKETKKVRRLLISIAGGDNLTIQEVGKTCEAITYRIHPEAEIAVGAVTRKDFKDIIKVTFLGVKSIGSKTSTKLFTEERRGLW